MATKTVLVFFFHLLFLIKINSEEIKRGFILTTPRIYVTGRTQEVCMAFNNIHSNGSLNIKLVENENGTTIATVKHKIETGSSTCLPIEVPHISVNNGTLIVSGSFEGNDSDYVISEQKLLKLNHNNILVFIQADKPIYKSGESVTFRILCLTPDLKPSQQIIRAAWITNPSSERIYHWTNVLIVGFKDLILSLPSDAETGKWKIDLSFNEYVNKSKEFLVDHPDQAKMKIEIKTEPHILFHNPNFTWTLCIHDSFGKWIKGHALVKLKYEVSVSGYDPPAEIERLTFYVHGCKEISTNLNISHFELNNYDNNLLIDVLFEVDGTGKILVSLKKIPVKKYPLILEFENTYLKPKLPYYGRVLVTSHDGKIRKDELINITLTRIHGNNLVTQFMELQSNEEGFVDFIVNPSLNNNYKYHFMAATVDFDWPIKKVSKFIPKTLLSSSENFLQIRRPKTSLPCRQIRFPILYNEELNNQPIYYEVVSRGKIVLHDSIFHTSKFAKQWIPHSRTPIFNDPFTENEAVNVKQFYLLINIIPAMLPKSSLFVYYMRHDNEVVSDSVKFTVDPCWNNEVDLKFITSEFNEETYFQLKAKPYSVCAVSLNLHNEKYHYQGYENQLSVNKILDAMVGYDIDKKAEDFMDDICKLRIAFQRRLKRNPSSNTCSIYGIESFDDSGLTTLSDSLSSDQLRFPIQNVNRITWYDCMLHFSKTKHQSKISNLQKQAKTTATDISEMMFLNVSKLGFDGFLEQPLPKLKMGTWTATAICLNDLDGIGISDSGGFASEPYSINVNLPWSVDIDQHTNISIAIRNKLPVYLDVKVRVKDCSGLCLENPTTNAEISIPPGKFENHQFKIKITTPRKIKISTESSFSSNNASISSKDPAEFKEVVAKANYVINCIKDNHFSKLFPSTLFCEDAVKTMEPQSEEYFPRDEPEMPDDMLRELERQIIVNFNDTVISEEPPIQPVDTDYDGPPVTEIIPDPIIRTVPPPAPTIPQLEDDDFLKELEGQIIPVEELDKAKTTEQPAPILLPKETDYDGPPVEEIIQDPVTSIPLGVQEAN